MKLVDLHRRQLGISGQLKLGISALFLLIVLIIAAWIFSLHLIIETRKTITTSTAIERKALDMDRLLEKARRLHGDFFLQYTHLGLAEAHVQFAQPSVRTVAQAITASSELKKMIDQSNVGENLRRYHVDLNLYLASAKRFADTSLQSIDLITRLATPDSGAEANFTRLLNDLKGQTASVAAQAELSQELALEYQQYKMTRQRPLMQSVFNRLFDLNQQVNFSPDPSGAKKLQELTTSLKSAGEEILSLDLEIKNKFSDFNIQSSTVQPIAQALINQAGIEVSNARIKVTRMLQTTALLLALFALAALYAGLLLYQFISHRVIRRITELSETASRIKEGNLVLKAAESPADELGILGQAFNHMNARIQELVNHLESRIKQRTAQLNESERRIRRLANELPNVGIIGFDESRRVFFWNHACERLYGSSAQEASGQTVEQLISADAEERNLLGRRLQQWIDRDMDMPGGEARFTNREGAPVEVFVTYFTVDGTQRQELYSIHIDLSELKKVEAESVVQASIYRSLFDHTSSGVGVLQAVNGGSDFLIKDINPAAERIEGCSREHIIGRSVNQCFHAAGEVQFLTALRTSWQTGKPGHLPPMHIVHGNTDLWEQGHVYKIPTGEIVFVYDDISQLKEAELKQSATLARLQRARKMEAIGQLAGGVAHDLNNILTGIVGYPDLLLMQLPPDSHLRKTVLAIRESGQRAAAVVADLLTVARGVSSEQKHCLLNTLIEEHLSSPEHQALLRRHSAVSCETVFADDLWPITCSRVHIKKSLMNLLTNGAEAIDHSGTITIRTRNAVFQQDCARQYAVDPGKYVMLEVADTGSGIAPEDISRIFEPFYTRKIMGRSGTGLGLAVVWNTVQDHRGGVTVTSNDQGTVFTLLFPACEEAVEKVAEDEIPATKGNGETILVVDDDLLQREIAEQLLRSFGYRTVTAPSGEEAVEYLKTHRVDLVLLDMLMDQGINGRQTYERILLIHPEQKALIVSGFSENDEVREALRLGVSGYLQKPFTSQSLASAVNTALSRVQ